MTCQECGAGFSGRVGQRFCARPCRNAFHNARHAGTPRAPRAPRAPRTAGDSPRRGRVTGSQTWMTDPSVVVCKVDACFWDAPCPEHGAKNLKMASG